jgi:hypothetical protein
MKKVNLILVIVTVAVTVASCKKEASDLDQSTQNLNNTGSLNSNGSLSNKEPITKVNTNMTFFTDCIKTLDVRGFGDVNGVKDFVKKPTHTFLFLVAATVRDDGENRFNALSPTADIGLKTCAPKTLKPSFGGRRLFGPYWEGYDTDDHSLKYEWLDDCSMRYNNFAIADLTEHLISKIRVFAQEGDDFKIPFIYTEKDDVIFDFDVSIAEIKKGNNIVTGKCDIEGKCATFCFAIGSYAENKNCGTFWSKV